MKIVLFRNALSSLRQQPLKTLGIVLSGSVISLGLSLLALMFWIFLLNILLLLRVTPLFDLLDKIQTSIFLLLAIYAGFNFVGFFNVSTAILNLDGRLKALQNIPVFKILLLALLPSTLFSLSALVMVELYGDAPTFWVALVLNLVVLAWMIPRFSLAVLKKVWPETNPQLSEPEVKNLLRDYTWTTALAVGLGCVLLGQAYASFDWLNQPISDDHFGILVALVVSLCLASLATALLALIVNQSSLLTYQKLAAVTPASLPSKRFYLSPFMAVMVVMGLVLSGFHFYFGNKLAQLEQEIDIAIAAQKKGNAFHRPTLWGKPIPGNGEAEYWQILGKTWNEQQGTSLFFDQHYPQLAKSLGEDLSKSIDYKTGQILPQLTLTEKYQPVFTTLRAAASHEYIQSDYEFSIDSLLPNFILAQNLSKLMVSRILAQCGQTEGGTTKSTHCRAGAELFLDSLRLGQDIQNRGTLIDGMVGIVIKKTTLKNSLPVLTHHQLAAQDLADLLPKMKMLLDSEHNLLNAYLTENLTLQHEFVKAGQKPFGKQGEFFSILSAVTDSSLTSTIPLNGLLFPNFRYFFTDGIEKLRAQYKQFQDLHTLPKAQQAAQWLKLEQISEQDAKFNPLLAIASPNFNDASERQQMDLLRLRTAYLYLALEAYHAQHQHYPRQLQELVPAVIPELPINPFSGQSFAYQQLSNGQYELLTDALSEFKRSSAKDLKVFDKANGLF